MSLKGILKEFSDSDIPKELVQKVNNFDGVDNMKLIDDTPFADESAQAYVYLVKNNRNKQFVFRIRKPIDNMTENFDKFVDHDYPNIVQVYFHRTLNEKYEVTIMEYLPETIGVMHQTQAIKDLFIIMDEAGTYTIKSKINRDTFSDYLFDGETDIKKHLRELYEDIPDVRHLLDDTIEGIKQYHDATGDIYMDLHEENVMRTYDGIYKLIDL